MSKITVEKEKYKRKKSGRELVKMGLDKRWSAEKMLELADDIFTRHDPELQNELIVQWRASGLSWKRLNRRVGKSNMGVSLWELLPGTTAFDMVARGELSFDMTDTHSWVGEDWNLVSLELGPECQRLDAFQKAICAVSADKWMPERHRRAWRHNESRGTLEAQVKEFACALPTEKLAGALVAVSDSLGTAVGRGVKSLRRVMKPHESFVLRVRNRFRQFGASTQALAEFDRAVLRWDMSKDEVDRERAFQRAWCAALDIDDEKLGRDIVEGALRRGADIDSVDAVALYPETFQIAGKGRVSLLRSALAKRSYRCSEMVRSLGAKTGLKIVEGRVLKHTSPLNEFARHFRKQTNKGGCTLQREFVDLSLMMIQEMEAAGMEHEQAVNVAERLAQQAGSQLRAGAARAEHQKALLMLTMALCPKVEDEPTPERALKQLTTKHRM